MARNDDLTAWRTDPEMRFPKPATPPTIQDTAREVGNELYPAVAAAFERLEAHGLINGNAHHMAQKIVGYAQSQIKERWRNK